MVAGFALFLASRDRLSAYARILWGDKPESHVQQEPQGEDGYTFDEFTPFGQIERALPKLDLPSLDIPNFNWELPQ